MDEQSNYWQDVWQRRISRRAVLGSAAAAAFLAACGKSSPNSSSTKSPGTTQGAATTQGTPKGPQGAVPSTSTTAIPLAVGKRGGNLTYGFGLSPGTLDAAIPVSGGDAPFLNMFYDPLLVIRHFQADPTISLAQKWEVADPTTIVFHLRPGVQFHDGTPFNAQAVQWNINRIKDPATKSVGASYITSIDHVDTPDDLTVSLSLKQPDAALFFNLASVYGRGMVSPTAEQKMGKALGSHPVGTGPYVFKEWAVGSHVTGTRNPNYWHKDGAGTQLPYLDEYTIQIIPDQTVLFANLQTGNIDMGGINFKDLKSAQSNTNLVVQPGLPGGGVPSVWVFNLDKPPANEMNIRRAIAYALQPAAVGHAVYFDNGTIDEANLITPGSWAYTPIPTRPKYDLTEAKKALAASSQPNGFSFDLITYSDPSLAQSTQIYQQNLATIGIKANITTQDVSTATDSFFAKQEFPIYSTEWGGTVVEPDSQCEIVYTKSAFYNPMKRAITPDIDGLITKAKQTYDQEQRKQLYAQIDTEVLDQIYYVPQVLVSYPGIFRKNVGNSQIYYDLGYEPRYMFVKS
jgi:peptide/nickel transport system substrate-binding protein